MKSLQEYLAESKSESAKKKQTIGSSRIKCVQDVVEHIKKALGEYDISTRKYVWNKLTSKDGEHLMDQIVKYPKTSMSMSNFTKLVMDTKK